jgi:hypothetical protein
MVINGEEWGVPTQMIPAETVFGRVYRSRALSNIAQAVIKVVPLAQ